MAKKVEKPSKGNVLFITKQPGLPEVFEHRGFTRVFQPHEADIIVFPGDTLVSPFLIGERTVGNGSFDFSRDKRDIKLFKLILPHVLKIGINRGAVLLNILCGGSAYQSVDNHEIPHHAFSMINGKKGKHFVPSNHDQMMIPSHNGDVLVWSHSSTERVSDRKVDIRPNHDDPEVVYYEHENTLCCQFDPTTNVPYARDLFFNIVDRYI